LITSPIASSRIAIVGFSGALALGAFFLIAAGPAPQLLFPSDVAAYLDACHRAALGQWLGRDFNSPIGPAALLPAALAMRLGGATVDALAIGSAFTWLAYGILAWLTARPRMPSWLAGAFALFVAASAAAPYTLDFGSWRILSYGMLYNRLAWAALAIAAVAGLLPRQDGGTSRWGAVGFGACAAWLWAIKPNYLLILIPLFFFHGLLEPNRRCFGFVRALGGALGLLTLVWLWVRFSPVGYIATHLGMAQEAPPGLLAYTFTRSLRENFWPVLVLIGIWGYVLKNAVAPSVRLRLVLALSAVIVATFATNIANCQFSEIPLWGALGWVAAAGAIIHTSGTGSKWIPVLAGAAFGLAFSWQPLASIAYNFVWKHYRAPGSPPAVQVTSTAWAGMPMRPSPGEPFAAVEALESAGNYAAWLNDGLAALACVRRSQGPVLCLDWTNPFPFATQTIPATGDEIAWHVGRTVGAAHHPDVARLLASAAIVMEPRRSLQPDSLAFKRALFERGLHASFVVEHETAHWRVWSRRDAVPAKP
jgi:hypothetical protein